MKAGSKIHYYTAQAGIKPSGTKKLKMETVWGVKWPTATFSDVVIILFFIALGILIYVGVRLLQYNKKQEINNHQLFLFKTKQLGLSNFQIKIINNMTSTMGLTKDIQILEDPDIFEQAVGKFLSFLTSQEEQEESLSSIGKEIIIMHEKLYHPNVFQKKLEQLSDMEKNTLLTFMTKDKKVYIGKLMQITGEQILLKLFRHPREIRDLPDKTITVIFWRAGDAEYSFQSNILSVTLDTIEIAIPEDFTRGKEVRHPYIDTITPCRIRENSRETEDKNGNQKKSREPEKSELHRATMFKLNEHEAIVRTREKLNYQKDYKLEFEISDFKMNIQALIIADRTIREETLFYYTFRFKRMSEAANKILSAYIIERLS